MRKFATVISGIYNYLFSRNAELRHDRLKDCVKCEYIDYDYDFYCSKCDCTLKHKASLIKEKCPIGKWQEKKQ